MRKKERERKRKKKKIKKNANKNFKKINKIGKWNTTIGKLQLGNYN